MNCFSAHRCSLARVTKECSIKQSNIFLQEMRALDMCLQKFVLDTLAKCPSIVAHYNVF